MRSGRIGWALRLAVGLAPFVAHGQTGGVEPPFAAPGELEVAVFAKEPDLRNPVSVSVAADGTVYTTETSRRKSANLDIRANADWIETELSLDSSDSKAAFYKRALSPERSAENRGRVADVNGDGRHDWRDLTALSERIHALRDTDGDGVADQSNVFAAGFQSIVTGVAGGVLAHDGDVFATIAPNVWRLRDLDGDGVADQRDALASGFAAHIAYAGHNMHGLVVGPDGRLYWSIGDTGSDARPHEGAVFRCELDGSGFEVFARGLRNPQELAFDHMGNLFTGDNDADLGDRERWVHVVPGADYGWRIWYQFQRGAKWDAPNSDYSAWMEEKLWHPAFPGQAAYILPGERWVDNGPCGLTFNPGSALGDAYANTFFMAHFTGSTPNSSVRAYRLERRGATFSVTSDERFFGDSVITGLDFARDGSALFAADWSGGWPKNERGRVYRVWNPDGVNSEEVVTARAMLNRPANEFSDLDLREGLRHGNYNVRLAAQFELARRKNGASTLREIALNGQTLRGRRHAIWGLGILGRNAPGALDGLEALFRDENPEIRAQFARIVGEAGSSAFRAGLERLLGDPDEWVVFEAANALSQIGSAVAFGEIVRLLPQWGEEKRFLRYAGIRVLESSGDPERLVALRSHASSAVRIAAVVALRRLGSGRVAEFLPDGDPLVALEAARAINDAPIEMGREALAGTLSPALENEGHVRRALNANYRVGDRASAERVMRYAADSSAAEFGRIEALRMLAAWESPSPRDRVCGGWFPVLNSGGERYGQVELLLAVAERIDQFMVGPEAVQDAASALIQRLESISTADRLFEWAMSEDLSYAARTQALESLSSRENELAARVARVAIQAENRAFARLGLEILGAMEPEAIAEWIAERVADPTVAISSRQVAIGYAPELDPVLAESLVGEWLEDYASLPNSLRLDVVEAAKQLDSNEIGSLVKALGSNRSLELFGGSVARGRDIFLNRVELQCLRCHEVRIDGVATGGGLGPSLIGIGSKRDRAYILESIVSPNAAFAEGFETALITLKGGDVVYGRMGSEDEDSVEILVPGAAATTANAEESVSAEAYVSRSIPKSAIASRQAGMSGMPPGLSQLMSPFEIRDLVEFLAHQ